MIRTLAIQIIALTSAAAAQEPHRYGVVLDAGHPLYADFEARVIPTSRWIWVETSPGIFAPEPGAPTLAGRDTVETKYEAAAALERLAEVLPATRDAGLWCIDWTTAAGAPRLACME